MINDYKDFLYIYKEVKNNLEKHINNNYTYAYKYIQDNNKLLINDLVSINKDDENFIFETLEKIILYQINTNKKKKLIKEIGKDFLILSIYNNTYKEIVKMYNDYLTNELSKN